MAEITINSVEVRRANPQDFGSTTGGSRIYVVQYDIPGRDIEPGEHKHIIPMAALVNYKLDTSKADYTLALQTVLQDCMSMHQTVMAMGHEPAMRNDDSPLVVGTAAIQSLHVDLDTQSQTLAATVPMVSSDDAHETVQDTMLSNAASSKVSKMKTGVTQFKSAVTKVQTSRSRYVGTMAPILEAHPVDTSVKPWTDLVQVIADDTDEFATEQADWFEFRFGRYIKQIAKQRLIEAGMVKV